MPKEKLMAENASNEGLDFHDLLVRCGITDEESGRAAAIAAREDILSVARTVISSGDITMDHIIVAGIVARSQSLHEGSVAAIEANNPHAAFTLLRAYAEQCAAVQYMTDHPAKAERLWNDVEGYGVKIGAITNYAQSSGRMANFREIYNQLSKYAHPSSAAHFASMRVGEDRSFSWQSAPRFKRDEERLIAYAWCVEFARATNVFAFEFAIARGLGRFVTAGDLTSGEAPGATQDP